jgi:ferredoxin-nitrite reductase
VESQFVGPDAWGMMAQDKTLAQGKETQRTGSRQTRKTPARPVGRHCPARGGRPFSQRERCLAFKYFGLFYVAPAQNSYMTRLRFPNGTINSAQMRAVAHIAREYGGNYAHVTHACNFKSAKSARTIRLTS